MLQYHGGKIFGKAENDTNLLAKTMQIIKKKFPMRVVPMSR